MRVRSEFDLPNPLLQLYVACRTDEIESETTSRVTEGEG